MVTISLPSDQRARFRTCLRRAGRREIGGILMGEQVAPDHFRIVDFSIDETTGTAAHFVRSPDHHGGPRRFLSKNRIRFQTLQLPGRMAFPSKLCGPAQRGGHDVHAKPGQWRARH